MRSIGNVFIANSFALLSSRVYMSLACHVTCSVRNATQPTVLDVLYFM
jgi:hypothetical protein